MNKCLSPLIEQSYGRFVGKITSSVRDIKNNPMPIREFENFGQDFQDFKLDDNGLLIYTGCRDRPFNLSIKTNIKISNSSEVCNKGYLSLNTTIASTNLSENKYPRVSDNYSFEGQSKFNKHMTQNSISSSSLFFIKTNDVIAVSAQIDQKYKIDENSILEIEVILSLLGSLTSYVPRSESPLLDCCNCVAFFWSPVGLAVCLAECIPGCSG